MATRSTVHRGFLLGFLLLTSIELSGCSRRPGGGLAFKRFWGFSGNSAIQCAQSGASGLIPGLISKQDSACEDPFLAEDFTSAEPGAIRQTAQTEFAAEELDQRQSHNTAALTLFESPPVSDAESETTPNGGNPFKLIEHKPTVSEVSSSDNPFAESPKNSVRANRQKAKSNTGSQLDRLRTALKADSPGKPAQPFATGNEVIRQRVEAIMKNARRQMQLQEYESALRWANAAEQLASGAGLFFGPEEDPPADLVRALQDRLQVSPQATAPEVNALAEGSSPSFAPDPDAEVPSLAVEFPESDAEQNDEVAGSLEPANVSPNHLSKVMQEASIAPNTQDSSTPIAESIPVELKPRSVDTNHRSLKVDAQRVNANQGAVVSVEGQLNPPAATATPSTLAWAPPADELPESPPFELAMAEPAHESTATPPPLPPPNSTQTPTSASLPFLYAERDVPPPEPVKNVEWSDAEEEIGGSKLGWWVFPVMGILGAVLLGLAITRRKA